MILPLPTRFFRRLVSVRGVRRRLFVTVLLAALIALFYGEENWRGNRAWENCRRELESRGTSLDWRAFIPAPIPDERNIFKAPNMKEWFVRDPHRAPTLNPLPGRFNAGMPALLKSQYASTNSVLLAEVTAAGAPALGEPGKPDLNWELGAVASREQARKLVQDAIGPAAAGLQGFMLLVPPADALRPARVRLVGDETPTPEKVREIFPTPDEMPGTSALKLARTGPDSVRVWLSPPAGIAAVDYLAWSDQCVTDLNLIREAVKRPQARIEGAYEPPYAKPTPNFVVVRTVSQMLAQRAQCYLLLGQPEAALRELSLVHDMRGILGARPMTLVAEMIDVAVTGLYASTVAEGLRLRAWREPQLSILEEQLKETDLLTPFVRCLESERAATCRTLETTRPGELEDYIARQATTRGRPPGLKILNPRVWSERLAPRGWVYQNMVAIALRTQGLIETIDLTNRLISTRKSQSVAHEAENVFSRVSPYTYLAAMAAPRYLRTSQTLAHNQTQANEARIACALERYRLAQGQYPARLEALVPQFIEQLPQDVINGQPLKYRRTPGDTYVLYSVGWNETDEGGRAGKTYAEGDWVWQYPELHSR